MVSEETITNWAGHVDINDATTHLLRQLRVTNHVTAIDTEHKTVRITLMSDRPNAALVTNPPPSGIHIPAPGVVSMEEMAAIRSDYFSFRTTEPGSAEISPRSEYGPGLSRSEFDSLRADHLRRREVEHGSAYVSPPAVEGNGLSAYDLADIKNAYFTTDPDPYRQISPESELGPGFTVNEVNALRIEHLANRDRPAGDERLETQRNYRYVGKEELQ